MFFQQTKKKIPFIIVCVNNSIPKNVILNFKEFRGAMKKIPKRNEAGHFFLNFILTWLIYLLKYFNDSSFDSFHFCHSEMISVDDVRVK